MRAVHAEATSFDNCVHILRALHQELIPLPPLLGPAVASVPQTLEHEAKGIKRARFSTLFYRPHSPNAEPLNDASAAGAFRAASSLNPFAGTAAARRHRCTNCISTRALRVTGVGGTEELTGPPSQDNS